MADDSGAVPSVFTEALQDANAAIRSIWFEPDVTPHEEIQVFLDLEAQLGIPISDHVYSNAASNYINLVADFDWPHTDAFVSIYRACFVNPAIMWLDQQPVEVDLGTHRIEVLGYVQDWNDANRLLGDDYGYEEIEGLEEQPGGAFLPVTIVRLRHTIGGKPHEAIFRRQRNLTTPGPGFISEHEKHGPLLLQDGYDFTMLGITGYKRAVRRGGVDSTEAE